MESKRQLKYAKLIQKELGDIFQKEAKHLVGSTLVTITRVMMSPDLGFAKANWHFSRMSLPHMRSTWIK